MGRTCLFIFAREGKEKGLMRWVAAVDLRVQVVLKDKMCLLLKTMRRMHDVTIAFTYN